MPMHRTLVTTLILSTLLFAGASCSRTVDTNTSPTDGTETLNTNQSFAELAKARDDKRINDLRSLQTALQFYASEHENQFPETLDSLVPTFLAAVPADPKTHSPYEYEVQGANKEFYTLQYTLEVGSGTITAGAHTMTQNGLATP